jgi:iron-sulfur cluster insertion protein|tara:strand:+ start:626 stop:961 length:336 start_codon:yes stop_codon:yes gene_type:complete
MITLTDSAIDRIKEFIEPYEVVRLSVEGGGCSGFQYKFGVYSDDEINEDDHIVMAEEDIKSGVDVKLVVDPVSFAYVENAEIDFEESSFQSTFKIKNPDAVGTCGCGESFY